MTKRDSIKTKRYRLFILLLFCATFVMGLGYASINGVLLTIDSTARVEPKNILHISAAQYSSNNGANVDDSKINSFSGTTLDSTIFLGTSPSSTITYALTIFNETTNTSVYTGTSYAPAFYDNANITYDVTNITVGEQIAPGASKTIYITFRYIGNDTSNPELNSYISFNFSRMFTITYQNINTAGQNYPTSILDGEGSKTITFVGDVPYDVRITPTVNYSYDRNTGVLIINNVTDNIVIDRYYTITYNANNGTNDPLNPTVYVIGDDLPIYDITRTDYIFGGWYDNNTNFTGNAITSTLSLSGDVTLYAKWLLEITYNTDGGTNPSGQVMYFCETINENLLAASKQYYEFAGWYNTQNTLVATTSGLSFQYRSLTAHWDPMVAKTTVAVSNNTAVFTASNISGSVNITNLRASSGDTYTYSGINRTGATITNVRVTLTYSKQKGKSESATCDVYSSYTSYQNNGTRLGTTTVSLSKGSNRTAQFNIALSGTNQIAEGDPFVILFSDVEPDSGSFTSIVIEFNV